MRTEIPCKYLRRHRIELLAILTLWVGVVSALGWI